MRLKHRIPENPVQSPARTRRGRPGKITVAAYAATWLETRSAPPFVSRHHQRVRAAAFKDWLLPEVGTVQLASLDVQHLERIQAVMLGRGLKLSTARTAIDSVLRSLWCQAKRERLVGHDPFRELDWPRDLPDLPDPFTEQERDCLVAYFQHNRPLYYSFVAWAFGTGLRPGELCGLRYGDLDFAERTATIQRALVAREVRPPKTQASRRTIAIAEPLLALVQHGGDRDGYLFTSRHGEPIHSVDWPTWHWRQATLACGIRHRRFYACRHSYISLALSAGAPALHVASYCGTSIAKIARNYARWLGNHKDDPLSAALASRLREPIQQIALDLQPLGQQG